MLSFATVHAITACLLNVEHDTPPVPVAAAEHLGTIVLAQDQPACPASGPLRALRLLSRPLLGDERRHLTLPAVLDQIADAITADGAAPAPWPGHSDHGPLHRDDLAALRRALCESRPGLRLLAWAICYDDLLADDEDIVAVRRVEAVDVDGRVYQISRRPGEPGPVVLLDEQADPDDLPATYPPLARLAAGQPAQT
ncbi:hypothetical protein [Dactylosporangium sp. CA-092794]|uniref:hypothetical protein n=1 Tax=Dactylosporangium sp. CA-092794 TaxID=3239929 RepID=UPI003D8E9C6A